MLLVKLKPAKCVPHIMPAAHLRCRKKGLPEGRASEQHRVFGCVRSPRRPVRAGGGRCETRAGRVSRAQARCSSSSPSMPAVSKTCSSCSLRIARAHVCDTPSFKSSHGSIRLRATSQRAASSAAATALRPKPPPPNDAGHRVLTVLHKTRSLLPHILPPRAHAQAESGTLDFWERVLGKTYDDLCPSPEARQADRVRIAGALYSGFEQNVFLTIRAVYGCDEFSGSRELVAALLEEPFASEAQRKAVHSRWNASGPKSPLVVECVLQSIVYRVVHRMAMQVRLGCGRSRRPSTAICMAAPVRCTCEDSRVRQYLLEDG